MKMIISGGGTGGHIYPALAIAREVLRREPDSEILYIGTKKGLESDLVPKEKIPFESVEITGFKRSLSFENIRTILRFIKATQKAKRIITEFKPDVVVGTGGYVCGPVVYAASSLKIPTLIHEQNVIPGLTNKFLSRYTNRIAVSFSGSAEYFYKGKTIVTGNPRATEVVRADGEKGLRSLQIPSGKKVVLIVGGSRGARAINEAVSEMIPFIGKYPDYHFIYVTGEVHFQGVQDKIRKLPTFPGNLTLRPFIYNMPEVLAGIDLIVNRAGASFLAEITALGLPSILIPSPYVTNNHQEKNARWIEKQGAGIVILESELTGTVLLQSIHQILSNPQLNNKMRVAAKSLGQPEAATIIYEQLKAITRS